MFNTLKNSKKIFFIVVLLLLVAFIIYFKEIALLFFASYVIASAINPFVDRLSNKMPRALAIALIYLIAILVGVLFLVPLISITYNEIVVFSKRIPAFIVGVESFIQNFEIFGESLSNLAGTGNLFAKSTELGTNLINQSINFTFNIIIGLTLAFTLGMMVIYMLLDKQSLKDGYLRIFPPEIREDAERMTSTISAKVGGYVTGQLVNMLYVGVVTSIGLFAVGSDFAILLGFMAGLLDIIPIAGPIIAFAPAALLAIGSGWGKLLAVILIYSIAQWSSNNFIKPIVFGRLMDLHPLIIILAIFIAAKTLGVVGVILSPAIAALVCVLFEELYIKPINLNDTNEQ